MLHNSATAATTEGCGRRSKWKSSKSSAYGRGSKTISGLPGSHLAYWYWIGSRILSSRSLETSAPLVIYFGRKAKWWRV